VSENNNKNEENRVARFLLVKHTKHEKIYQITINIPNGLKTEKWTAR
jgi:hypothetical protein